MPLMGFVIHKAALKYLETLPHKLRCRRFGVPSWHRCYPIISRFVMLVERWLIQRRMKRERTQ